MKMYENMWPSSETLKSEKNKENWEARGGSVQQLRPLRPTWTALIGRRSRDRWPAPPTSLHSAGLQVGKKVHGYCERGRVGGIEEKHKSKARGREGKFSYICLVSFVAATSVRLLHGPDDLINGKAARRAHTRTTSSHTETRPSCPAVCAFGRFFFLQFTSEMSAWIKCQVRPVWETIIRDPESFDYVAGLQIFDLL